MQKKIKEKQLTVDGRQFVIKKFDAYTGSYITFKLSSKILPLGLTGQTNIMAMIQQLPSIGFTKAEFLELQKDCLGVCYEIVNNTEIPVLNDNGSFRAIGLEDDFKTVMTLTVQAVAFNAQSFFGETNLEDLMQRFSVMKSTDAQTSTSSPMDQ